MAGRFSYALDRAGPTERSRMENYINHIFNMDCIAGMSVHPERKEIHWGLDGPKVLPDDDRKNLKSHKKKDSRKTGCPFMISY